MMSDEIEEVVIAGAGPAGLVAAITLARLGVRPLLVERRSAAPSLPRATATSLKTMELLRAWGVEPAVLEGAVPDVEWLGWVSPTLREAADGAPFETGMPTRAQAALISPTAPACVPQDHLEPVLAAHARALGVRIETGVRLAAADSRPDGARLVLGARDGGCERRVEARYLIGADGIRSTVRAQLGIPSRGRDGLDHRLGALFRAPLGGLLGSHRYGLHGVTHPEAEGTFLPAGRADRWLYAYAWDPHSSALADHDAAAMAARIRTGAGVPDLPVEVEQLQPVTFGVGLADRFRHHSAFLIGDAAHRVTPRGGTGMNTAIRDGHDLGWKLGWVLNGWAGEALLDSYEAERRPVAAHNLARSADVNGSVRTAGEEVHVDLGGRIAHVWVAPGTSSLDLPGDALTLLCGPEGARSWSAHAGTVNATPGRPPLQVHPLAELPARALGVGAAGALLVRPDRVPAGAWAAPDGAGLRRAVEAVAGLGAGAAALARAA